MPHPPPRATLAPIERLGEFELLKRLGAGAQAEVWLAVTGDEQLVALKVMLEHLSSRDESRATFMREARTSALLRHPNLVEVYDVGEADGRPWLVMELVRGVSLSALLKKLKSTGARLEQDEAAELIRQAALGLHFAHELKGRDGLPLGLVHRDVSPQNIMVSEAGIAKVVDFGLAKATAVTDTVTATIKGKLRYMPPEQLKSQKLDRRCDVFALGAVLWELASGSQLYPGASEAEVVQQALYSPQPHPDEIAKGLSRGMVSVLLATTAREADKRMGTAKELAEALAPLSSPHARDKLTERMAKTFERLPTTIEEARGLVAIQAGPTPTKNFRGGLLLPPKTSYVGKGPGGPVPIVPKGFRERQTDQVEAQFPVPPDTNSGVGSASVSVSVTLAEPPSASTAVGAVSGVSLGTLVDADTGVMTSPGAQTIVTSLEEAPTHAVMLNPPSRRTIALAVAGSFALVAVGGLIGLVMRFTRADEDSSGDPVVPQRMPDPSGVAADEVEADGGAAPAKGASRKKRGRVEIECNVTATVREGGVDLGQTPFARAFTPGRHKLSVVAGDSSYELDVVVTPGGVLRKQVKLNR